MDQDKLERKKRKKPTPTIHGPGGRFALEAAFLAENPLSFPIPLLTRRIPQKPSSGLKFSSLIDTETVRKRGVIVVYRRLESENFMQIRWPEAG